MTQMTQLEISRGSAPSSDEVREAREFVRSQLERVASDLSSLGIPRPHLDGKILRPLAGYLIVPPRRRAELDDRFWRGTLAVEMVHEASLLHDDILDDAPERRGRPTLYASAGVGPALVLGDHLLTGAYRMAAAAESPTFLRVFIEAVERTVAGEIAQERAQGRVLSLDEYRTNITGKSGELFRAVFSLAPSLLDLDDSEAVGELGARLGCIYQMVDDALDYCPDVDRGKVPLQDYRQEKWTWPLSRIDFPGFQTAEDQILQALFRPGPRGLSPLQEGLEGIAHEVNRLWEELSDLGMEGAALMPLLRGWVHQLRSSAAMEADRFGTSEEGEEGPSNLLSTYLNPSPGLVQSLREESLPLATAQGRDAYFAQHAKTFRFASRLFPVDAREKVSSVYAFCRFTDDLVDDARGKTGEEIGARLDAWEYLARRAYEREATGVGLLDHVMGEMRRASVPFFYAQELVEGVRMDLQPRRYATLTDLRLYSFRVASVVGGWLTELFGVHDPAVLDRAYSLGQAMQLTNILRDVGEDLARGRIYLPEDRMARHGVDEELLQAMAAHGAPIFPGYHALLEELMAEADAEYQQSFSAIPFLPPFFQGPVAIASQAYQGIHDEIRRNDYNNLTLRASTSLPKKVAHAAAALLHLRRLRRGGVLPSLSEGRPDFSSLRPRRPQESPA